MLGAPRVTAVRLAVATALSCLGGALGCTSILGIDGTYTVDTGAGGKRVGTGDANGEGGTGAGGDSEESGGTSEGGGGGRTGTGATPGGGGTAQSDAGMPTGTGGTKVDPVGCQRGKYSGMFKGEHQASFTFVAFPLGVTGPLTFTLEGSGDTLQITNGKIDATLAMFGPFALTLDGTYNCANHMMSGHLTGKVNLGTTPIDGTLTGDLLSAAPKDAARPWAEQEQTPSGPSQSYKGTGFWNASYTGP
jgi:hypothetical protein